MIAYRTFKSGLSAVHYNGHDLVMVYSGSHKVFPDDVPPQPTIYRWIRTDDTVCVEDEPTVIYRWVQTEETTCVED